MVQLHKVPAARDAEESLPLRFRPINRTGWNDMKTQHMGRYFLYSPYPHDDYCDL